MVAQQTRVRRHLSIPATMWWYLLNKEIASNDNAKKENLSKLIVKDFIKVGKDNKEWSDN